MLPNTYEGKTAEELFPAFKPNAVSSDKKENFGIKLWISFMFRF
jgi:hypothetical protein